MMKYGLNLAKKESDICHFLKKLQEIEKLKILLLNEDQIKLFDLIPKPCLKLNGFQEVDIQGLKNKSGLFFNEDKDNYKNSFLNIKTLKEKTIIDEKLLNLIQETPKVKDIKKTLVSDDEI